MSDNCLSERVCNVWKAALLSCDSTTLFQKFLIILIPFNNKSEFDLLDTGDINLNLNKEYEYYFLTVMR
jgi:hypothetical protein